MTLPPLGVPEIVRIVCPVRYKTLPRGNEDSAVRRRSDLAYIAKRADVRYGVERNNKKNDLPVVGAEVPRPAGQII